MNPLSILAVEQNNALDNVANWVREALNSIPWPVLIGIGVVLLVLLVVGIVKKMLFLAIAMAAIFVIVGGLWLLGAPTLGGS